MGEVRARDYEAVIGVGGIGAESASQGMPGKVQWIGIGPRPCHPASGEPPKVPVLARAPASWYAVATGRYPKVWAFREAVAA
jgi:hypothetical protein